MGIFNDSRRMLPTFQIGSDLLNYVMLLRDAAGKKFKTSNSAVITSAIDDTKRNLRMKAREVEEQIRL